MIDLKVDIQIVIYVLKKLLYKINSKLKFNYNKRR
jgi:hypothetical protein